MTDDRRHHVATRREIIFVPIPVAGTVRETHRAKPPEYPARASINLGDQRPDRQARRNGSFAGSIKCRRQEEAVREFMKPDANLLKAWLGGVAVR